MNKAIAAIYAITIRTPVKGEVPPLTDAEKNALIDRIPALIDEINHLEKIVDDPFIRGYLERFGIKKSV